MPESRLPGERSEPAAGRDLGTIRAAQAVLHGEANVPLYRRVLPFLGPAFIASVAYVDPGNFATNIQAGAKFGYLLIWVIVASNLVAMLIQSLAAKLGIATGMNLAEMSREHFPFPIVLGMWVVAELVAMATDLAEFLGAAVGFNLLLHVPLLVAGILTAISTYLILGLESRGFRALEAVIAAMVGVIAISYLVEVLLGRPNWAAIGSAFLPPRFEGPESVLLAVGILGATVMPHVIFLHSHLTQNRIVATREDLKRRIFHFEIVDVVLAMGIAGLVNAAMLVTAATTFHESGNQDIATIQEAYRTLTPLLGPLASFLFGVALLASGLSSSTVGTMAGQVVMQGYLRRHIPVWVRRGLTMLPALVVIALGVDATQTLVISQVVLSFGLPFALVPLVLFTRERAIMNELVNHSLTTLLASGVTLLIVALNIMLIYQLVVT